MSQGEISLGSLLQENGPLPVEAAVTLTERILSAVEAGHREGRLHLALSPGCIWLRGDSAVLKAPEPGNFRERLWYTAPEVRLTDPAAVDEASDLYSVCAIFFRMVAGRDLREREVLGRGPLRLPGDLARRENLRKVLEKGLHILPRKRYQTPAQLRQALEGLAKREEGAYSMENVRTIIMNDEFDEQDTARYIKTYMFLKGYAMGKGLPQTMLALPVARKLHDGQYRKGGEPYITHPLKVCSTLISYGIDDDITLAAALLHDVLEDCGDALPKGGQELTQEYGVAPEILEIIRLLSKRSGLNDQELGAYFQKIERNPKAALIKLADRLHNSGSLYTFTDEKMRKYLRETDMFLLPMGSYCKKYYPQYANAFSILKSSIDTLNSSMKVMLDRVGKGGDQ